LPLRPAPALVVALTLLASSCAKKPASTGAASPRFDEAAFVRHHAELVLATYTDAVSGARALHTAVEALLAAPGAGTLAEARAAWRRARRPYLQSEAFRFYDGPIDAVEPRLNGWPVDERYIDAVVDDAGAGIINQAARYPTLTAALLVSLNERDGERNISLGFHAIEFLLWGEDQRRDGPGNRPYTDYAKGAPGARRRAQYLRLVTEALLADLSEVAAAWAPDRADNYRASFLAQAPRVATALILRGVGGLSGPELGGERLTVAYETKDQENEHSCFSDTTHEDVLHDLVGIANVCTGRYQSAAGTTLAGPGLCALVSSVDPALGAQLTVDIASAVAAARAVPAPFDQAILGKDEAPGRIAVKRLITAVEAETATLARVAEVLGIPLSLPVLARRPR
jgi:putative iron-regulated protein